jgi:hypothetical protein
VPTRNDGGSDALDAVIDVRPDVLPDLQADVASSDTSDAPTPADVASDTVPDAPIDVAADVVHTSPCAGAINLNALGTVTGSTTTYSGSNASAPTMAAFYPMACTTATGAQVIHTYRTTTTSHLRVSTVDFGTTFDTVALAISDCGPRPMELGCNNDDPVSGTVQSQFLTGVVPAGTTVIIIVGGYSAPTPVTGRYVLRVSEVPDVSVGGNCDPMLVTDACTAGSSCVTTYGVSTCMLDGSFGGFCRATGTPCDPPYVCNFTSSTGDIVVGARCVTLVALGGACDPTRLTNVCDPTAHCITSAGTTTCIADGSLGGRCRVFGVACDPPYMCSGSIFSAASRCVP